MCHVAFFQRHEFKPAKVKKTTSTEGGPPFNDSHANEFDHRFYERFDGVRVDYMVKPKDIFLVYC